MLFITLIPILYFINILVSPGAHECLRIKNSLFSQSYMYGEEFKLDYSLEEAIHLFLEKSTYLWVLVGSLATQADVHGPILILLILNHLIFNSIENQNLRDWLYRITSVLSLYVIISNSENLQAFARLLSL